MRSRSFLMGDEIGRLGAAYWVVLIAVMVFGALWRAGVVGEAARAPGLSALVFLALVAALYAFVAFPLGVAGAVASIRWPRWPAGWLIGAMLLCAAATAGICDLGRMKPEWGVLALYAGVASLLCVQAFVMTRWAWLNERD
jgi:hypothetical protein